MSHADWIGAIGQNPRKGVAHSCEDVAAELADVALNALVAIESLGMGAKTTGSLDWAVARNADALRVYRVRVRGRA